MFAFVKNAAVGTANVSKRVALPTWLLAVRAYEADFVQNLIRDLKSIRAFWNYIIMALYVWASVWLVLYDAETCGNTVIITTGGVVVSIFTNYVWSSRLDRQDDKRNGNGTPAPVSTQVAELPKDAKPDSQ